MKKMAGFGRELGSEEQPFHTIFRPLRFGRRPLAGLLGGSVKGMLAAVTLAVASVSAEAQDDVEALKSAIEQQRKDIERQRETLILQNRALEDQRRRLEALEEERRRERVAKGNEPGVRPAIFRPPAGLQYAFPPDRDLYVPSQQTRPAQAPVGQAPVGQAPEQRRPSVPVIPERGGVLTPQGNLVVEPSFEWSHSDVNRFTFQGVEIVDTVLLGVIETQQAERDTLTAALAFRYGLVDRLEIEVKVPYVYRSERTTNQVVEQNATPVTRNVEGHNIGDVEWALHLQLNNGRNGWPFFVGNVRVKSDTGTGPFDVERDNAGIETELATGSGFWGVEPSVTVIYPSDPAVLFGNVGYLYNFQRDLDKTIGASRIGRVKPGDAVRMAFGVGFALNEDLSLSLGYQHDFIQGTEITIDGVETESETLNIGSLTMGINFQVNPRWGVSTTLKVGATEEAPDVSLLIRVPIRFSVF